MPTYIALLRAVNVGGTGKLPMAELKAMCVAQGFTKVQTYIASGNVVFAAKQPASKVKALLEGRLHAYARKPIGVIVRTADEMMSVLKSNPFPKAPPNRTVAIFLDDAPPTNTLTTLQGQKDEEVRLGKREIDLCCLWRRHSTFKAENSSRRNRDGTQYQYYRTVCRACRSEVRPYSYDASFPGGLALGIAHPVLVLKSQLRAAPRNGPRTPLRSCRSRGPSLAAHRRDQRVHRALLLTA
jgi:uncharacterized protein (DUF1697 family)